MLTQIRLLLEEQSDQGIHCFPLPLQLLDALLHCQTKCYNFSIIKVIILGVPSFRIFTEGSVIVSMLKLHSECSKSHLCKPGLVDRKLVEAPQ